MGVASSTRKESWAQSALDAAAEHRYDKVHALLLETRTTLGTGHEAEIFFHMVENMVSVFTEEATLASISAVLFVMKTTTQSGEFLMLEANALSVENQRADYKLLLSTPIAKWNTLTIDDARIRENIQDLQEGMERVGVPEMTPTACLALKASAFVFVINFSDYVNSMVSRVLNLVNGHKLLRPETPPQPPRAYMAERKVEEGETESDEEDDLFFDAYETRGDAAEYSITFAQRTELESLLLLPLVKPYRPEIMECLKCSNTREMIVNPRFQSGIRAASYAELCGNTFGAIDTLNSTISVIDLNAPSLAKATTAEAAMYALVLRIAQECPPAMPLVSATVSPKATALEDIQQRWASIIRSSAAVNIKELQAHIEELQTRIDAANEESRDRMRAQIEVQQKLKHAMETVKTLQEEGTQNEKRIDMLKNRIGTLKGIAKAGTTASQEATMDVRRAEEEAATLRERLRQSDALKKAELEAAAAAAELSIMKQEKHTETEDQLKSYMEHVRRLDAQLADAQTKAARMEALVTAAGDERLGTPQDIVALQSRLKDQDVENQAQVLELRRKIKSLEETLETSSAETVRAQRAEIVDLKRQLETKRFTQDLVGDVLQSLDAGHAEDARRHAAEVEGLLQQIQHLKEQHEHEMVAADARLKQLEADARRGLEVAGANIEAAKGALVEAERQKLEQMGAVETLTRTIASLVDVKKTADSKAAWALTKMQDMAVPVFQNGEGRPCRIIMKPLPHMDNWLDWQSKVHGAILKTCTDLRIAMGKRATPMSHETAVTIAAHEDTLHEIKDAIDRVPGPSMVETVELISKIRDIGAFVGPLICGVPSESAPALDKRVAVMGNIALAVMDKNSHLFSMQTVQRVRALMAHGVNSLTDKELDVAHRLLLRALQTGLTAIKLDKMENGDDEGAVEAADALLKKLSPGRLSSLPSFEELEADLAKL